MKKVRNLILSAAILGGFYGTVSAAFPVTQNLGGNEYGKMILAPGATSVVFVAGESNFNGDVEIFLEKYDLNGNLLAGTTFQNPSYDDYLDLDDYTSSDYPANKMLVSGNYIYFAGMRVDGLPSYDIEVFKYDFDLNFISSASYDTGTDEFVFGMDKDAFGNIYIAAYGDDGGGTHTGMMLKYNPNLNLVDTSTSSIAGDYSDITYKDIDVYGGNIYIGAIVDDGTDYYPMIAKVSTADLTAISTYVYTAFSVPDIEYSNMSVVNNGKGRLFLVGDYVDSGVSSVFAASFDENLNLSRSKTFTNGNDLTAKSLQSDSNGNISFGIFNYNAQEVAFYRVNPYFTLLSSETVSLIEVPECVYYDAANRKFYVTGYSAADDDDMVIERQNIIADEHLLRVKARNGETGEAFPDASIAVIGFNPATMSPDPDLIFKGITNSSGVVEAYLPAGKEYMVAFSSPNWAPTIRDQIMDPYGNFNVHLDSDQFRDFYFYPLKGPSLHTLTVNIVNISTNDILLSDVLFAQGNRELVSSGMLISTADAGTMEIYNVPDPEGATYVVKVFNPEDNFEYTAYLDGFPAVPSVNVDMSSALPPSMNYEGTSSTNPPSYAGFVSDDSGTALENVKITVYKEYWDDSQQFWQRVSTAIYEAYTDSNGRFAFYDLPYIDSDFYCGDSPSTGDKHYLANIKKLGFSSAGECFNSEPDMTWYGNYQLSIATYTLKGQIQFNGVPVPYAKVDIWGDWEQYAGSDTYVSRNALDSSLDNYDSAAKSDAHLQTDANGNFTVTGMTDGNIRLNASFWSSWSEYNSGPDGQYDTDDDLRITISSAGATGIPDDDGAGPHQTCSPGEVWVVDASGACISTGTVIFNLTTEVNTSGVIEGTMTFITTYTVSAARPLVISSASPVVVMAIEHCRDNCQEQKMALDSVSGTFAVNKATYSISITSGTSYWTKIISDDWGKYQSFEDKADLSSTGTVHMDFKMVKSGKMEGIIKLPSGMAYRPNWGPEDDPNAHWVDIEIQGLDVDFRDGMGVKDDGTFEYPNLPPGKYNVFIKPRGEGFKWPPARAKSVKINVGRTTKVEIRLEEGLVVQPQIVGLPEISTAAWGYTIIPVPSGTKMNRKKINEIFYTDLQYEFEYDTMTATWNKVYMEPGQYDFYLILGAKYESEGDPDHPTCYEEFVNFIGKTRGVAVKKDSSNPLLGTYDQPIPIAIMGQLGAYHIEGTVRGDNIFTDPDFERIFANFDSEIPPLIPTIMFYDSAGELKAFSHAMPDEVAIWGFMNGLMAKDKNIIISTLTARPLEYYVPMLPPSNYTAVFANPNYPPVSKEIALLENKVYDFNFDEQEMLIGTIRGVVKSSFTQQPVNNAKVFLTHRTMEKFATTDSSGVFVFDNLPTGSFKVEVRRYGYAPAGVKASLGGLDTASFDIYLATSSSVLSGKVYLKKYPSPLTRNGIKVIAYDDTQNVNSPNSYLVKYEARTNDDGEYSFQGVVAGHKYKVAAFYEGKLPETLFVTISTTSDTTVASDMVLKDIPPQIKVKIKKDPDNQKKLKLEIKSPQDLLSVPSCVYNYGASYDSATAVTLALISGPNNTYYGEFTTSISQPEYTIRVAAGNGRNRVTKVITYNTSSNAKTEQYVDRAAIEGGEVNMDEESEEYTGLGIDTGGMTYSTGTVDYSDLVGGFFSALPSVKTVKTDKGEMTLESSIASLMASDVYNIDLEKAQPNKPFSLNLKYEKEGVANPNALRIYQYVNGIWKEVPGNYTIDPMLGVVSVDVASIDYAYEGASDVTTPLARKKFKMSAISPQGTYVPRSGGSSQKGQFAVFTAKPGTGIDYLSSSFEIYNMPNPFNLKAKTITNIEGTAAFDGETSYSTEGTIIKYHLPPGKSGNVKFVIYNVAGEKVRTIDEGNRAGGKIYYSEWDGKNDNGERCASGVYFMLTFVNGEKLGSKALKMAIIK